MNDHKSSGELAEVLKLCWSLPSVPLIQDIKYQKHESVIIGNVSTESNINNNNNKPKQIDNAVEMVKVASISVDQIDELVQESPPQIGPPAIVYANEGHKNKIKDYQIEFIANDEGNNTAKNSFTFEEWLTYKVKLPQYYNIFVEHGYESLDIIKAITDDESLKEIGIELPGHIKKIRKEIFIDALWINWIYRC
eukprot:209596_1